MLLSISEKNQKKANEKLASMRNFDSIQNKVKRTLEKQFPYLKKERTELNTVDLINESFLYLTEKYGWDFSNNLVRHYNKTTCEVDTLTEKQFVYVLVIKARQILQGNKRKYISIKKSFLNESEKINIEEIGKSIKRTKVTFVPFDLENEDQEIFINPEIANQLVNDFTNEAIEIPSIVDLVKSEIEKAKSKGQKTFQLERLLFYITYIDLKDEDKINELPFSEFDSNLFENKFQIRTWKNQLETIPAIKPVLKPFKAIFGNLKNTSINSVEYSTPKKKVLVDNFQVY